jgi:hypothetical protein
VLSDGDAGDVEECVDVASRSDQEALIAVELVANDRDVQAAGRSGLGGRIRGFL